jgi:hypothetical protein
MQWCFRSSCCLRTEGGQGRRTSPRLVLATGTALKQKGPPWTGGGWGIWYGGVSWGLIPTNHAGDEVWRPPSTCACAGISFGSALTTLYEEKSGHWDRKVTDKAHEVI